MAEPDEFDLIERYFAPLATAAGAYGLRDDAALLSPPPGMDLVLTTDALIEDVHYMSATAPENIAAKLFAVNLSDLAAKGATPTACLLTFGPRRQIHENWIAAFAEETGNQLAAHNIMLLGGDTVAAPTHAVFSLTLIGTIATGEMVRRSGAQAGDDIYVTGTVGQGFIGLQDARAGKVTLFREMFERPQPPLAFGIAAAPHLTAAADISDGLAADLGHICHASGLGMQVNLSTVPLADPDWAAPDELLTGGDDYQMIFTANPTKREKLQKLAADCDTRLTRIGVTVAGNAVQFLDAAGAVHELTLAGYRHFSE